MRVLPQRSPHVRRVQVVREQHQGADLLQHPHHAGHSILNTRDSTQDGNIHLHLPTHQHQTKILIFLLYQKFLGKRWMLSMVQGLLAHPKLLGVVIPTLLGILAHPKHHGGVIHMSQGLLGHLKHPGEGILTSNKTRPSIKCTCNPHQGHQIGLSS